MKKKLLFLLASVALVVSLTSCTTFKTTGLTARGVNESYDVVGTMNESFQINKFFGVSGGPVLFDPDKGSTNVEINALIDENIDKFGGDAIVNLDIEYSASLINMLCNGFTGSIWAPSTAKITGTVIKY